VIGTGVITDDFGLPSRISIPQKAAQLDADEPCTSVAFLVTPATTLGHWTGQAPLRKYSVAVQFILAIVPIKPTVLQLCSDLL
jgi:hypothetical protein